jgi:Uma2 family endonuclease
VARGRLLSYLKIQPVLRDSIMLVPSAARRTTRSQTRSQTPSLPVRIIVDQDNANFTIPVAATTLQGFREWSWSDDFPQQGRISFIDGEIVVDMSKERIEAHVKVKGEIGRVVSTIVRQDDLGEYYTDGTGISNVAANVSHVPDGMFVSWHSFEVKRVLKVPSKTAVGDYLELEGSPDWILEVVSPSSVHKDLTVLLELYHKAGITEYWVVDARGDKIKFHIHLWQTDGYAAQTSKGGWQWSPVFKRHFRLKRTKNRIGGWQYDLEVKP